MSKNIEIIEQTIEPIIKACGYNLLEVEYAKTAEGMTLTVFIFKDGGINIDDCEKVHNAIESKVEEIDISNGEPYNLSVSSFGLTRQLKTTKEFCYRLDEEIEVKLFEPINNLKEYVGKLIRVDDDDITLLIDESEVCLQRKLIASAKLKLDF